MAMNSAPSSRYRTASELITPMSESALEIGCFCSTRLKAQATETIAHTMNRIVSMKVLGLEDRHAKGGSEQVEKRARKQKSPGEMHELVVAKARQCATDPDVGKEQEAGLAREPENRRQISLQKWNRAQEGQE